MKILVRNGKKDAWKLVEAAAYKGETELQQLLAESPTLISIESVREGAGQLIVAVRELQLTVGSIDLLAFSARGDMTVIECKLAANPEVKRKVIGQSLDYAAHLWQMSYEELDQKIHGRTGKSLADLMRAAQQDPQWDEGEFCENVRLALKDGSFILMIVVDEMTDELSHIIHFVNTCGRPCFSFAALEMRRFQNDKTEMLIPRVVGDTCAQESNSTSRKRWTEEMFFQDARERLERDQSTFETMTLLYNWSKEQASFIRFGSGVAHGSFTFVFERDGQNGSVFSVYSDGSLALNFGYMKKIFSVAEIDAFAKELNAIETFKDIDSASPGYKMIATLFPKPEYLQRFQEVIMRLKNTLLKNT